MESRLSEIINFRRELHAHPELSGNEEQTAKRILNFLGESDNRKIRSGIGGNGILMVYDSGRPGPEILFRGDIDALPIPEQNQEISYSSVHAGVAHLCGHDGHTAILAGLVRKLDEKPPEYGKIIVLFQPSEENGFGAKAILDDPRFDFKPDASFALHNLPGYEKGEILLREGCFAYASTGMIIQLKGKTSHAAEADKGLSPETTIVEILGHFQERRKALSQQTFFTVTHLHMGEKTFGISPGEGEIFLTLRSVEDDALEALWEELAGHAERAALKVGLGISIERVEYFPSTTNSPALVDVVKEAVSKTRIKSRQLTEPFRWSEDFGWFSRMGEACLFGLGSGLQQPALHNPDYNFPDDILEHGIDLFYQISCLCQKRPL